jgi:hypothetical protein
VRERAFEELVRRVVRLGAFQPNAVLLGDDIIDAFAIRVRPLSMSVGDFTLIFASHRPKTPLSLVGASSPGP